ATELLRKQLRLEDAGVQLWARQDYDAAVQKNGEADEAYRNDAFADALALYKESLGMLSALEAKMPTVHDDNVARGKQALDALDAQSAIGAFTIATAIDPKDDEAKSSLQRALKLDDVLAHLHKGDALQTEGKLDAARAEIAQAHAIDPALPIANEALNDIDHKIDQRNFADAMSRGLAALSNEDFEAAKTAFEDAANILPDSPEPKDGLEQVEQAVLMQRVQNQREQAKRLVDAEDWKGAKRAYEAIADLDATLLFAREGIEQATSRIDLAARLDRYIQHPALMAADDELSAAKKTLVEATRAKPQGDRIKDKVNRLASLIAMARIPVTVELKSDNATDVTIYRVGEFGRIDSRSVELIPGDYTIVGKRRGYRDVQVDLELRGGHEPNPIYVSCTEKI
ncbi:MAG: hypothetical protein KDI19_12400, partial [Pseudomonadales bacterium]|nr:hypothetical protein [Pseudomonadales bacterium]